MLQSLIEIFILSAIQGISEFLPISSSAHLIIVSSLHDLNASSLLIDISLHLGSLLAIIFFFDGYTFFEGLIIINEKVYRLTYTLIIILKM